MCSFLQKNPLEAAKAPGARAWRKKNEGLKPQCTAKGSKEGSQVVKLLVGITHGAGITVCEHIAKDTRLNGNNFAQIIRSGAFEKGLEKSSDPTTRMILQDNCPVQNSKVASRAFAEMDISLFEIPARSPDLNCIENLFHQMKQVLRKQAREYNITNESKEAFAARVQEALINFDGTKIDKLIETMPKRINDIILKKGDRLKY